MAVKTIRKKREPDWDVLIQRTGGSLGGDKAFRRLLDNIHNKCYVEAEGTRQYGEVTGIIRDRYGVPVAVEVEYKVCNEDRSEIIAVGKDCIAMSDITFWEPWDHDAPADDYEDDSDLVEYYLSNGYEWDDERGCYYNKETGDEAVW